jgi:TrmH family RNA methyltransferase
MRPATTSPLVDAEGAEGNSSVVDSLLHPQAVLIRRLLTPSERREIGGLILVDDSENIIQAIRAGVTIRSVFHSSDTALCPGIQQSLPATVTIYSALRRTCKKLFGNEKASRVFAIAEKPSPQSLDVLTATRRDIVVLDGIGITGNIGAIIRTASAMGVGGIVMINADDLEIFDRRIIRASRGYVFGLRVVKATVKELVQHCTLHGIPLLVTMPRSGTLVSRISSLPGPLAIVYGGEKEGCSAALIEAANLRVEIPMTRNTESLNVGAAAAITLYCRYPFNLGELRNDCAQTTGVCELPPSRETGRSSVLNTPASN